MVSMGRKGPVLIVEDDKKTASLVALYLEREGFPDVRSGSTLAGRGYSASGNRIDDSIVDGRCYVRCSRCRKRRPSLSLSRDGISDFVKQRILLQYLRLVPTRTELQREDAT